MTVTRRNNFREAASVIANPENGIITVRATGKQHEKIQEFIDQVMTNARRQVLIEATIVEVRLSDNYQQGIDWSRATDRHKRFYVKPGWHCRAARRQYRQHVHPWLHQPHITYGQYRRLDFPAGILRQSKVLSSPKLSVMNNQTAMLRVVDNKVYFTVNSTTATMLTRLLARTISLHHYHHHRADRLHDERDAADQRQRYGAAQHASLHYALARAMSTTPTRRWLRRCHQQSSANIHARNGVGAENRKQPDRRPGRPDGGSH